MIRKENFQTGWQWMDIILLESMQRRMTKMIEEIRNFYERRLKLLKLHSLETWDLIEAFKWVKSFNKEDVGKVLMISSQDRTRNNGFKLEQCWFIKKICLDWFTNKVVDDWNRLSHQIVSAQTIGSFKGRLDGFMDGDERWVYVIREYWSNRNYLVYILRLFVASLYSNLFTHWNLWLNKSHLPLHSMLSTSA